MFCLPRRWSACFTLILFGSILDLAAAGEKKIIEFGWDIPTPDYVRQHAVEMEKLPFDGVVIDIAVIRGEQLDGNNNSFALRAFGRESFRVDQFEKDIEDLQAAPLRRLTHNFLRFNVTPGNIDWFDDFTPILQNARVAGTVARRGGLKGICLDLESYKSPIWCYPKLKYRGHKRFLDYAAQIRRRGREFMRALNQGYPDVTLLVLPFTYWSAYAAANSRGPLASWPAEALEREADEQVVGYGLLPYFIDGLLETASDRTTIVDGWEKSYGYRFDDAFRRARETVKQTNRRYTADARAYDRHVQVGFGIWADFGSRGSGRGWHRSQVDKNYFTPVEFEWSVRHALNHTDRYVWIYSERLDWWRGERVHPEYAAALRRARQPRELDEQPIRTLLAKDAGIDYFANLSARHLPGWSDAETFGHLWHAYRELAPVPLQWRFQVDPDDVGNRSSWFATEFDDREWRLIPIGNWWERAGFDYDGVAWYRVSVEVPELPAGKRARLYFGAVDESARVYVNGRFVGEHDRGWQGWEQRFSLDVTDVLRAGQPNLIAVRVMDRCYGGGIWKSVKLVVEK